MSKSNIEVVDGAVGSVTTVWVYVEESSVAIVVICPFKG